MPTIAELSENSRPGFELQKSACIGLENFLSQNLRWGCGHVYDETATGIAVYVRNDPVNYVDPDGHFTCAVAGCPEPQYNPPPIQGYIDPSDGRIRIDPVIEGDGWLPDPLPGGEVMVNADQLGVRGFIGAWNAVSDSDCANALGLASPGHAKVALNYLSIDIDADLYFSATTTEDGRNKVEWVAGFAPGDGTVQLDRTLYGITDLTQWIGPNGYPTNLASYYESFGLKAGSVSNEFFFSITLLHELGHVTGQFETDVNKRELSESYTRTVIDNWGLRRNLWVTTLGARPDGNAASVEIRKKRGFPPPLGKVSLKSGATFPHFHRPLLVFSTATSSKNEKQIGERDESENAE